MYHGRVLIVDDDSDLQTLLRIELEASNYFVLSALDGSEGLSLALEQLPDLIILDVNLPTLDGLSVCREVRSRLDVPILMLSSLTEHFDKVVGLEVGADDYLGKPFNPRELVARVRALLRRFQRSQRTVVSSDTVSLDSEQIRHGRLVLDTRTHESFSEGRALSLTPIEFSLLRTFLTHPNQVFSRQQLLDKVWGHDFVGTERTVDTHVRNLRLKLGDEGRSIESVRGIGFKLV